MTMTLALFSKQRGFRGLETLPAAQNRARIPFPSVRCASAIQIVRPAESTADTQPQLQAASLRLSAMISQDFTRRIIRVCDAAGNVIERREHKGDIGEP
jgi:hypothetical protein